MPTTKRESETLVNE
uniref:Eukaryotic translation initiation factor 5A eIF-5A n=1 Tax=Rhizophora mucronata TaxID=61149 RepID=A0A2P2QQP3_RHIMU